MAKQTYELIQHFSTSSAFRDYLFTLVKPSWFKVIVTHHTYIPTVSSWAGLRSMNGMLNYYKQAPLNWDRFPHIFAAPDGIWTMNKLTETGIHANAANSFSIGIEVVGNYDIGLWQEPVKSFALEAHSALMDWGNIPYENIHPHRKYNPSKTCPGKLISMEWVVNELKNIRGGRMYKVIVPVGVNGIIRQGPSQKLYDEALRVPRGTLIKGGDIKLDESNEYHAGKNTWVHVKEVTVNGEVFKDAGFIHSSVLQEQ